MAILKSLRKKKGGRPNVWKNAKDLQKQIDSYFEFTVKPTLAGLSYSLGVSRSTLYAYEANKKFSDIIKRARNRVEQSYEERLVYGSQPTGVIFALKNMGWKDKTETDITSKGQEINQVIGIEFIRNGTDQNKVTTKPETGTGV